MRASWVIVLVAACGGGGVKDIKDTPPREAEATCRTAGAKLIELVVAGQTPPPPDDAVNKVIAVVEKRCETDAWKPEARTCFSKVKTVEDADGCSKTLTEQQLANLSGDMAPPGGRPPGAAEGASPPKTEESRTRGALPTPGDDKAKGSGNGASADPCDGGE